MLILKRKPSKPFSFQYTLIEVHGCFLGPAGLLLSILVRERLQLLACFLSILLATSSTNGIIKSIPCVDRKIQQHKLTSVLLIYTFAFLWSKTRHELSAQDHSETLLMPLSNEPVSRPETNSVTLPLNVGLIACQSLDTSVCMDSNA